MDEWEVLSMPVKRGILRKERQKHQPRPKTKFSPNTKLDSPKAPPTLPIDYPSWLEKTVLDKTPVIRSRLWPTRKNEYTKAQRDEYNQMFKKYGSSKPEYIHREDCPYGTISIHEDPSIPCLQCYHKRKNKCLRPIQDLDKNYKEHLNYRALPGNEEYPENKDDLEERWWWDEYDRYVNIVKELESIEKGESEIKPNSSTYKTMVDVADSMLLELFSLPENDGTYDRKLFFSPIDKSLLKDGALKYRKEKVFAANKQWANFPRNIPPKGKVVIPLPSRKSPSRKSPSRKSPNIQRSNAKVSFSSTAPSRAEILNLPTVPPPRVSPRQKLMTALATPMREIPFYRAPRRYRENERSRS
jgi:hypothetical protein